MKGKFEKNLNGTRMNADFQDAIKLKIFFAVCLPEFAPLRGICFEML